MEKSTEEKIEEILRDGCNNRKIQDLKIDRVEKDYNGLGTKVEERCTGLNKKIEEYRDKFEGEYKDLVVHVEEKTEKLHSRINQILIVAIVQLCALVFVLLK